MTPEREQKFREVIGRRQPELTVIMENIHDPHNVSAILRSCDAVGILEVHVIQTKLASLKLGRRSSASARKWVKVNYYKTAAECCNYLKNGGFSILATHLSKEAAGLYELDLTKSVALAFGNEQEGVSDELLKYAEGNFHIPMMGMIPSLNVSVACAVSLYEALRQRIAKGMYTKSLLNDSQAGELYKAWTEKKS